MCGAPAGRVPQPGPSAPMEGHGWVVKTRDVKLVLYVPWTCVFTSNRGRINEAVQRVSCSLQELPAESGYCLPWSFSHSKSLWLGVLKVTESFSIPCRSLCCTSPSKQSCVFRSLWFKCIFFFLLSLFTTPPPPFYDPQSLREGQKY